MFNRKVGWALFWVGLAGLLAGILFLAMIQSGNPMLEEFKVNKSVKYGLMISTIASWIVWKVGKTILKLHDQDDINEYRYEQAKLDSQDKTSPSHS